ELGELARAFERMRVQLAQLEHARREFVANASHELRTPLFSLGGFLELMSDEELDEPTRREFVATMRDQVDRLTKLAEELLDLTRLDAGRSVENDGFPIPPEHRGHLFQRFYRIDGTRASRSGLGLAIAQELAELMGGSISLESPSDKTIFRLKLPKRA